MSAISTVENCMYQANIVLPVKRLLEAPGDFRDDIKKSMSDKKLNSLSLGGRGVNHTHSVSLSDIDSVQNSVIIHKVVIVVIDYNLLKYILQFHFRLFMHNIVI